MSVLLCGLAAAVAVGVPRADRARDARESAALERRVIETGKLERFDLQTIIIPARRAGEPVTVPVTLDGAARSLVLRPHTLRTPDFRVTAIGADGVRRPAEIPMPRTYRGHVEGRPGSLVAASIDRGRVSAYVADAGQRWWVQPADDLIDAAPDRAHVAYRAEDLVPAQWSCAVPTMEIEAPEGGIASGGLGGPGAAFCLPATLIAFDADVEFFLANDSSIPETVGTIEMIMNTVEMIYVTQVGIAYETTEIVVREEEEDPYTTTDPDDLLIEFFNEWELNQTSVLRDVAHLFTGKDLDGNVAGVAYLGAICDPNGGAPPDPEPPYGLSSTLEDAAFSDLVQLTAHELGHNWSATHCNDDPGDISFDCGIMCTTLSDPDMMCPGDDLTFGTQAAAEIETWRDSVTCLDDFTDAQVFFPAQFRLLASDGEELDRFGDSVDVSTASMFGPVLVVGAPFDDVEFPMPGDPEILNAGSAYVYRWNEMARAWIEEAMLTAFDPVLSDAYASSVAVDGDVIAVGARFEETNIVGAGSVYMYRFDGLQWLFEEKLEAGDQAADDRFGSTVALRGNVLLVGSPREDENGLNAGAVYVFTYDEMKQNWDQRAKIIASDGMSQDEFGTSIALEMDPMSGLLRAAVGAPFADFFDPRMKDPPKFNRGTVYLYESMDAEEWDAVAVLGPGELASGDEFGHAVSLSGDVLAATAWMDDDNGPDAGSAFIFERNLDGNWVETAMVVGPNADIDQLFGESVSIDGNLMLVGANGDDAFGGNSGGAYAYARLGGLWQFLGTLIAFDGDAGDRFGVSVAVRDGIAAVGSWLDDLPPIMMGDPPIEDQGSVDVFFVNVDCDDNGIADVCDIASCQPGDTDCADCNDNGLPDPCDIASGFSEDVNGNDVPDECEVDCNNNGIDDEEELANCDGSPACSDCNGNGILDECDIAEGVSEDCNLNGLPDECPNDDDCDGDGLPDDCAIAMGISTDCDGNGLPDECDLDFGFDVDCNMNGILDGCDITDGTDADCNGNGTLDGCDIDAGLEGDCDGNNVPDSCELLAGGQAADCNGNGILDVCDVMMGVDEDCNDNDFLDSCDLAFGVSTDCNGNLVPDDCDIDDGLDTDCDGNGLPDDCQFPEEDCNFNGVVDSCDIDDGTSHDDDVNGFPDDCTPVLDCNGNFIEDEQDVMLGISEDCDGDLIPDECQFDPPDTGDCNGNGVYDGCDIAFGDSIDFDLNNVPDECQPDCNNNSIPDSLEIATGLAEDCNQNDNPDSCDLAFGFSFDLNLNGIPDECDGDCNFNGIPDEQDILFGFVNDCNENMVPDVCDIQDNFRLDINVNGIPDSCEALPCFEVDIDGDGFVTIDDLVELVVDFGPCPAPPEECPSDITGDGLVGIEDVLQVIVNFGFCPDVAPVDPCPEDISGDNEVAIDDVVSIIIQFGPCTGPCNADIDGNGFVDVDDLIMAIVAFGPCPEEKKPIPCPGDINDDGFVTVDDVIFVVIAFGTDGIANGTDLNGDGLVDVDDVIEVIINFGACPDALPFCLPDVSGNGMVDLDDLIDIVMSLGPCSNQCPADLTQDGIVTFEDILQAIDYEGGCGGP